MASKAQQGKAGGTGEAHLTWLSNETESTFKVLDLSKITMPFWSNLSPSFDIQVRLSKISFFSYLACRTYLRSLTRGPAFPEVFRFFKWLCKSILKPSWIIWGRNVGLSWVHLSTMLCHLGAMLSHLGAILEPTYQKY